MYWAISKMILNVVYGVTSVCYNNNKKANKGNNKNKKQTKQKQTKIKSEKLVLGSFYA